MTATSSASRVWRAWARARLTTTSRTRCVCVSVAIASRSTYCVADLTWLVVAVGRRGRGHQPDAHHQNHSQAPQPVLHRRHQQAAFVAFAPIFAMYVLKPTL